MTNILIIPDAHSHPEFDNDRFEYIGHHIVKTKPDKVICIGDFADLPSLSSYDKGTKGFEGRRYVKDLECVHDAQERLFRPIKDFNRQKKRNKEKQYKPEYVMCLGNHCDRISRAVNCQPELDGAIGLHDLEYEKYWEVIPFREAYHTEGIAFSHYFASGVAARPISGEHIAASLCNKLHQSAVQGHSHLFNHAERTRPDGQKIFGLSVGCISHPDQVEGWNRDTSHLWWRGIVELNECDGLGYYDQIVATTLRKLERDYG
jgi:hypothetical protein